MKTLYILFADEHSRVILPDSEWDPLSSYINANFIRVSNEYSLYNIIQNVFYEPPREKSVIGASDQAPRL